MIYYIAQFFGILGLIVMIYSLFQKNKNKMLWFVVLNGLFFGCQYFLLLFRIHSSSIGPVRKPSE